MIPGIFFPLICIGISVLIAGLSIPLILRKIPMNSYYGVRFPQSYKSDDAWYAINEYGGKALLLASIPVFLVGLYGLFRQPEHYSLIGSGILALSPMLACLISYLKAHNIDTSNPS